MVEVKYTYEPDKQNPQILNDFLVYLNVRKKRSRNTIEKYQENIRQFLEYICKTKQIKSTKNFTATRIKQITIDDIEDFVIHCSEVLNNAESTINNKIAALDTFYKYLVKKKMVDGNIIEGVDRLDIPKRVVQYLTLDETIHFLDTIKNSEKTYSTRDYCLFILFFNCGFRLSELTGIDIEDVDFKNKTITVIGKGNKERTVEANEDCMMSINNYLSERTQMFKTLKDTERALFISQRGKRISNQTIETMIKEYAELANLDPEKIHVHMTRHTCATLLLANKVDIRTVQSILGHSNINTTVGYAHVLDENKRKAVNTLKLTK